MTGPKDGIRLKILVCLLLLTAVFTVYSQVAGHEFVRYDVDSYILRNHHVRTGLTRENIAWAFTATRASNWHPLTWISHMADCELFGLDSGKHHLVNVAFHMANMLLLFLVLSYMTGETLKSAFVAALFGLHPLAVESVAWAAERKDMLFTFFWMAAMGCYARYAEKPGGMRYLPVAALFVLGLMSKPMIITLPCVFLLLDVWPLCRLDIGQTCSNKDRFKTSGAVWLVLEKLPLFILSAASVWVTIWVQNKGGAVGTLESYAFSERLSNAVVSYVAYLDKMVWPAGLAVFYPYRTSVPAWEIFCAATFIAAVSIFGIMRIRKNPWLPVGWFWFLGTLLPVIGIIQVGMQSMADRYAYVTLIGIYIIIAWCVDALVPEHRRKRAGLAWAASMVAAVLMVRTYTQIGYWKTHETLFAHAVSVTEDNYVAHNSLGSAFSKKGAHKQAISHYREAIRLNSGFPAAHNNLGITLAKIGNTEEAIFHFKQALGLYPDFAAGHYNLGMALEKTGRLAEARRHFSEALGIMPDAVHVKTGLDRINVLIRLGKNPDNADLRVRLAKMRVRAGDMKDAANQFEKALAIKPDAPGVMKNLGYLYTRLGEFENALSLFEKLAEMNPPSAPDAWYAIACIHARQNRVEMAVDALRMAVQSGFDNMNLVKSDENLKNIRHTAYWRELAE